MSSESESSIFEQLHTGVSYSTNNYMAHSMEYVVCETVAVGMSNSSSLGVKEYCCNICSTKKPSFSEIKSHMFNHIGAIPYFCVVCNFSDISLTQLFLHLLSHEEFVKDPEKVIKLKEMFHRMVYTCNLCFFSFKSSRDLTTHYIQHIANSYKCKSCKFVFFTDTELLIHAHYHSLSLFCRVCDKSFPSNQKAFLLHVLSHDNTRLYRNFPKVKLSPQNVPFYKSFFEICNQVSDVDFPMYCGILRMPQQKIGSRKPAAPNEVNQPVSNNHSPSNNLEDGQHSNLCDEDVKPDIFKIPFFGSTSSNEVTPNAKKNLNCLSPIKVSLFMNENAGIENEADSVNQLTSNIAPCKEEENIKSPIKTPVILKSWSQKDCFTDFNNPTDISQDVKEDEDSFDSSINENCILNNDNKASNAVAGPYCSKLFSYPTESIQMQGISQNNSSSNQNVEELCNLDGRTLKVVLDKLPEDIFLTVEADTNELDKSLLSAKIEPSLCFKYLSIVVCKLPDYVNDFDSFTIYEKELRKGTFPTTSQNDKSIPLDVSMENQPSLVPKNSGKYSDEMKPIGEFSSLHNLDNTASEEVLSKERINSPKKRKIKETELNKGKKARSLSPILTHETFTNSFTDVPSSKNREMNDLKADTASFFDINWCVYCEKNECDCVDPDDIQCLDVGEDINSMRNRIQNLKVALESLEKNYVIGFKG